MSLRPLVTALRTLTILPVPGSDVREKTHALPFLCAAGLVVAGLHLLLAWLMGLGNSRLAILIGPALCALNVGITGALHLDGLADTADAFGMIRSRDRTLAILKDPHIGTFGVAAVALALLWRSVAYGVLVDTRALAWLLPCMAGSRALQGVWLSFAPYARPEGGTGSAFVGNRHMGWICILELVLCTAASVWALGRAQTLVVTAVALLAAGAVCVTYQRRLGGITGDGIGAATELYELAFMTTVIAVTT